MNTVVRILDQIDHSCFTDEEIENKTIQIIDLILFIEAYKPKIDIVNCSDHQLNIVKDEGIYKGVLIFETESYLEEKLSNLNSNFLKSEYDIQELILVFVEDCKLLKKSQLISLLDKFELEHHFDKIFKFNFFTSVIHQLK